jgi:hypothetical protein
MTRLKQAETDKCPSCLHLVETAWHIFSCPNRSLWRNKLLSTLADTLRINKTQPDLTLILLQGVRGALHNPTFQMPVGPREPVFQFLVAAQNQIGWDHLLKGRFSHHWLQVQQLHIHLNPDIDDTKQSSERWLKRILHHIWTSLWQGWLARNEALHGHDRNSRARKRLEKITPQVVALYAQAGTLLAADRDIFDIPIERRLQSHIREIETWVRLVTPTVKRAVADANQLLHTTNHTMHTYLIPRADPLTVNEQVNELRPVSRLAEH